MDKVVQEFCFPGLRLEGFRANEPSRVKAGWGFRNLLGAMHMQMRWLMAAGAELKRCE